MPRIDVGTTIDEIKDEGVPAAMPAGEYLLKVEHAEIADNKAKDGQLLLMHHSVVEPVEYEGRKIMFDRVSLKPQALWKLKRFLKAAEVPYEGGSFTTEDVLGSKFRAQVVTETYNGKLRNNVDDYIVAK